MSPMIRARDYKTLASVRAELRAFAHFSQENARRAGLTPQQHQVLLALRATDDRELTIGEIAATMHLKPHSISGMADRLANLGLVERIQDNADRRRIGLRLTKDADAVLASLAKIHKAELLRIRPLLLSLLSKLD